MSDINYRELLKKYMENVIECEGISFIGYAYDDNKFTKEELADLIKIEAELDNRA